MLTIVHRGIQAQRGMTIEYCITVDIVFFVDERSPFHLLLSQYKRRHGVAIVNRYNDVCFNQSGSKISFFVSAADVFSSIQGSSDLVWYPV